MCRLQIYGLVQDCSNSSALAMELLQSCTMPSICFLLILGDPCHLFTHVVHGYFIGTIEFKWTFNQQVEYIGTWAIT